MTCVWGQVKSGVVGKVLPVAGRVGQVTGDMTGKVGIHDWLEGRVGRLIGCYGQVGVNNHMV